MRCVFSKNLTSFSGGRSLEEMKDLEWIFIGIHSLGAPVAIVLAVLHDPATVTAFGILAGLLAGWNAIAAFLNHRIATVDGQVRLGIVSQAVIAVFACAFIFQFVPIRDTAGYAGFAIVIIEGAVRFGLIGSLVMWTVFALGLAAGWVYREWEYDLRFSVSGYVFWTILLLLVALSVGLVTEEARRERRRSAFMARERTVLEERQRIARALHDTVLKTLHGLALETHVLRKQVNSTAAQERADYIQGVCERSAQEIRDVIDELRSEDNDEGIASQMSRMLETWSNATGIETEFIVSGDDRSMPQIASYNLRSVLSEALENVRKHASASHVGVYIQVLPGEMRLEIADNGKGISYSPSEVYGPASKGKYGILGMKERVEQLNGHFSIDSGRGTRLLISVPLVPAR